MAERYVGKMDAQIRVDACWMDEAVYEQRAKYEERVKKSIFSRGGLWS